MQEKKADGYSSSGEERSESSIVQYSTNSKLVESIQDCVSFNDSCGSSPISSPIAISPQEASTFHTFLTALKEETLHDVNQTLPNLEQTILKTKVTLPPIKETVPMIGKSQC
jgi:hypothetical protein